MDSELRRKGRSTVKKTELGDLEKMLSATVMIGLGIVPFDSTMTDVNTALESMTSKEDARVMKRKFRKLWRKSAREKGVIGNTTVGEKGKTPTKSQKQNRKAIVLESILKENVVPMMQNLKKGKVGAK